MCGTWNAASTCACRSWALSISMRRCSFSDNWGLGSVQSKKTTNEERILTSHTRREGRTRREGSYTDIWAQLMWRRLHCRGRGHLVRVSSRNSMFWLWVMWRLVSDMLSRWARPGSIFFLLLMPLQGVLVRHFLHLFMMNLRLGLHRTHFGFSRRGAWVINISTPVGPHLFPLSSLLEPNVVGGVWGAGAVANIGHASFSCILAQRSLHGVWPWFSKWEIYTLLFTRTHKERRNLFGGGAGYQGHVSKVWLLTVQVSQQICGWRAL